jgi:hypothetical protein
MIIRKLKPKQYEYLHKDLLKKAHVEPLDASYTVNMTINDVEYAVRIQPESRCRMAILQAFKIYRDEDGPKFKLITRSNVLLSLLEILIYQGVK